MDSNAKQIVPYKKNYFYSEITLIVHVLFN